MEFEIKTLPPSKVPLYHWKECEKSIDLMIDHTKILQASNSMSMPKKMSLWQSLYMYIELVVCCCCVVGVFCFVGVVVVWLWLLYPPDGQHSHQLQKTLQIL